MSAINIFDGACRFILQTRGGRFALQTRGVPIRPANEGGDDSSRKRGDIGISEMSKGKNGIPAIIFLK